ncbi:MAG: hypothetical protein HQL31_11700, partial [Planctomycetes bacterium]|nr:hypothetical protein [Planctomycetota bacterium]
MGKENKSIMRHNNTLQTADDNALRAQALCGSGCSIITSGSRSLCLLAALLFAWTVVADEAPKVRTSKRPDMSFAETKPASFEIPYLTKAPVIDGVLDETEWQQASAITGGVSSNKGGGIADRQFVCFMGWDEEALYLAMRTWQRSDEPFVFGGNSTSDNLEVGVLAYMSEEARYPYRLFLSKTGIATSDVVGMHARREMAPLIERFPRPAGWTANIKL